MILCTIKVKKIAQPGVQFRDLKETRLKRLSVLAAGGLLNEILSHAKPTKAF